jgi:hypothetical protein
MQVTKQRPRRLVFAGVTLVVLVMAARGCLGCRGSGRAPDAALGRQFGDVCRLAARGIDEPVQGVRSIGAYLVAHAGDMLKNFGDTVAAIERIADDEAHDERALVARERLLEPLVACGDTWERFAEAVAGDERASVLVENASERLGRTLAIILDGDPSGSLRELPSRLSRAIDRALPTK